MTNPKKAVVALSGGLDSAVLLAYMVQERYDCHAIGFNYGSKHNPYENRSATKIADRYAVPYTLFDIGLVMNKFSSVLMYGQGLIPEGHYQEESMRQTVVPGRNLIFLALAAGYAESIGAGRIAIGVHRGDHFIYPDCRPEFVNAAALTIFASSDHQVEMLAPLTHMNKTEIVKLGMDLRVPFEDTRTCYKDQVVACGKCGSCQERLEAFAANGVQDPIEYSCRELIPKTIVPVV